MSRTLQGVKEQGAVGRAGQTPENRQTLQRQMRHLSAAALARLALRSEARMAKSGRTPKYLPAWPRHARPACHVGQQRAAGQRVDELPHLGRKLS